MYAVAHDLCLSLYSASLLYAVSSSFWHFCFNFMTPGLRMICVSFQLQHKRFACSSMLPSKCMVTVFPMVLCSDQLHSPVSKLGRCCQEASCRMCLILTNWRYSDTPFACYQQLIAYICVSQGVQNHLKRNIWPVFPKSLCKFLQHRLACLIHRLCRTQIHMV